jgi:hypothetical protein
VPPRTAAPGGRSQGRPALDRAPTALIAGLWIDHRGALRYNWRVADEDANSVKNDNVQDDTRFDEVIHRFTKVSLEVALKTGEGRSTSPGGATCWTWSKYDVAASLYRCLTDGSGHAQEVGAP